MEIHCLAAIPIEQDEPVPAIRQFVRLLRDGAVSTEHAEIDLAGSGANACCTVEFNATESMKKSQPAQTRLAYVCYSIK